MEKETVEQNAKFLANEYREELQKILERNPIENLEDIENKLIYSKSSQSQLLSLVQELLKDLTAFGEGINDENKWQQFEGRTWLEINHFQQMVLQHFFTYNLLQGLFVSRLTPLNEKYRKDLLKKHELTPKKLKDILLKFWGDKSFLGEVKHGGSKSDLDDQQQLQFLAHYNRYQIIIKNARKEKAILQRKGKKLELTAKREALLKYGIPEDLIDSAFSSDSPSEVALDWAIGTLKIKSSREYLKILLNKIRKQHSKRGFIIDVNYSIGRRIYAFNRKDKQKGDLLRYTPPSRTDSGDFNDPKSFLVQISV